MTIVIISDDQCLLQNMDLVGDNLLIVKGVSSTFDCVNLCHTQPGCEAVVWITRTDTCLVKGSSPHLTTLTWVANSQGGAGVVVFLSCLEAAQIAMKSIEEAERRRNAENIVIAGVAENRGGYEDENKVVNGEMYAVESKNEGEKINENKLEKYEEARSDSTLSGKSIKAFSFKKVYDEPTETMDESSVRKPTETMYESSVRKPTETMDESSVRKPTETMDESSVRKPTETMDESSVRKPTETMDESSVRKPTETMDESSVRKPTETMDESSVRKPTETMDESSVRKPTETMDESSVRKPTETMDESSVRKPTERMDESSVRKPTETMDESSVRKPTETMDESSVRKPTETMDESSVRKPTETMDESSVRKPTETMDESSVRKPTETMDESSVRKPTETMDESSVRKPTETMDESSVTKPTETMDESSVRNPTERMDESSVRRPDVSRPGVQNGQHYGNTQHQWYNPDQWIRAMLEPVLSWWSWGSSPEKEDTNAAISPFSSSTYSTSSSTYSTSSSAYSTSSSTYSTSSWSSYSRSGYPNTDPTQNQLLRTIKSIGNWTVSAIQTIFTALGQAVTSKKVEEGEEKECTDSAKFCSEQLCDVEVVSNMCKKTCRSCPERNCQNLYSDTYCVFNAGLGHCQHPDIAANCPESCGKCSELAVCRDSDPDFCRRYGKFHCWNQGVRDMCSRSCFVC